MSFKHGKTSRLAFGETVLIDEVEFWDRIEFPTIPDQPDDIFLQVEETDRLETLAAKYYTDTTLEWVIAVANEMELPPFGLIPGTVIRVPSPRFVLNGLFLKSKRRGKSRRS